MHKLWLSQDEVSITGMLTGTIGNRRIERCTDDTDVEVLARRCETLDIVQMRKRPDAGEWPLCVSILVTENEPNGAAGT